jgi:hypothetical protein
MAGSRSKDMTGRVFGKLTVLHKEGVGPHGGALWRCQCECGQTKAILAASLRQGLTNSCGCLGKSNFVKAQKVASRKAAQTRESFIGQRFGRLVVLSIADWPKVLCQCDCGSTTLIHRANSSRTQSCGCLASELAMSRFTKLVPYGEEMLPTMKHPLYSIWHAMRARCNNPEHHAYANYGGRGITVCERWEHSFPDFAVDMGVRPDGMSLDRENNNLGYSPENCRWATRKVQSENKSPRISRKHLLHLRELVLDNKEAVEYINSLISMCESEL